MQTSCAYAPILETSYTVSARTTAVKLIERRRFGYSCGSEQLQRQDGSSFEQVLIERPVSNGAAFHYSEVIFTGHLFVADIEAITIAWRISIIPHISADAKPCPHEKIMPFDIDDFLRRIEIKVADLNVLDSKAETGSPAVLKPLLESDICFFPFFVVAFSPPFVA